MLDQDQPSADESPIGTDEDAWPPCWPLPPSDDPCACGRHLDSMDPGRRQGGRTPTHPPSASVNDVAISAHRKRTRRVRFSKGPMKTSGREDSRDAYRGVDLPISN